MIYRKQVNETLAGQTEGLKPGTREEILDYRKSGFLEREGGSLGK